MAIRDKQPDADVGRVRVDNDLESLEKRITVSYGKAAKDITTDLDAFLAKYETKDAKKREDVENGLLSEDDYIDWRKRQIFQSDAMKAKIDDLSQRMVNADKQAMAMVNNELPEIYATSYNFGGFRGEMYAKAAGFDYTQFTIINEDAVKTLMTEDPDLIPWKPDVDGRTDKAWNRKHIQNAVEQGIIKGDGMDKISRRLLPVVGMDKNAAIRTARTAVNGVENKGRTDATQRVVEAGIPMVQQWSCTHDNRTRFTHILIDGETISVGGYFSNGLRYPADPSGDPAEVYNCRCSAISVLEGIDHSKDDLYEQFMEDNYYDDWVKVKEDREEKEAQFRPRKEKAESKREEIEKKWAEYQSKRIEMIPKNEEIKEFSNKNSKIKQTLYHGSSKDFEKFETKHIGENTGNNGLFGEGLYFTQKSDLAESYADGGYVYEVKVNIENPFNWNSLKTEEQFEEFKTMLGVDGLSWNRYEKQMKVLIDPTTEREFTAALKRQGYDGVVYKYKGGAKEFVVFDDDQIKIIEKKKIGR